jgi:lauroyl/myristoyl acyltransferase
VLGDVERDTRTVQGFYECTIRQRPRSWLWMHERWKEPPQAQSWGRRDRAPK